MILSMRSTVLGILLGALFTSGWASAQETQQKAGPSPDQQKRIELMKSKGPEASLTILPIMLAGRPFERVSEVVGLLLEKQGLKNIELGKTAFNPGSKIEMERMSSSLSDFVKKNLIVTEYALYAEYNGNLQTGLDEIRAIVVDNTGAIVWTDRQGPQDEAFKRVNDRDPMGFSLLLVQRLSPQLGLNEETSKAAQPGKMARLMDERSGLPPENERVALPQRQKELKESRKNITLMVFPARIGNTANSASATELAKMIADAGLCKAVPAKQSLLLKAPPAMNEMKALWDLAREFRDYARRNPLDVDYALYADYVFNPQQWEQGLVHFVVCDRKGEWVIVDMQNSQHPDYQGIKPTSSEGCNKLLVKRLEGYLKLSIADVLRETIQTSGIEAAVSRFKELRAKKDEYNLSEQEINSLGYEYLQAKKLKEAIEVFKLNVEAFPQSFNVYDSLGEAYAAAGEKELAVKNYEKSLELNPKSQSGIDALKKLKAQ
jgi:tetratricopeptide (TPR) repeat protein